MIEDTKHTQGDSVSGTECTHQLFIPRFGGSVLAGINMQVKSTDSGVCEKFVLPVFLGAIKVLTNSGPVIAGSIVVHQIRVPGTYMRLLCHAKNGSMLILAKMASKFTNSKIDTTCAKSWMS